MALPSSQLLHSTGRGCFDFINSSKSLLSCGSEGSVRLVTLDPFEDSGTSILDLPDHQLVSICARTSDGALQFCLAKEESGFEGTVDLYTVNRARDAAELTERLASFSMSVTDMCMTADGDYVCIAAATEPDLHIFHLASSPEAERQRRRQQVKNQTGGILGVCGGKAKFCSIGEDGSLTVWKLASSDGEWRTDFSKKNYCQRSSTTGAALAYKPSFHGTDANLLAVPGQRELTLLRGEREDTTLLERVDFSSTITHTCFADARVFAASAERMVAWSLTTGRMEYSFDLEFAPTCLRASKDGANVYLLNTEGALVHFSLSSVSSSSPPPSTSASVNALAEFDEDESDEEVVVSLTKLKQEYEGKTGAEGESAQQRTGMKTAAGGGGMDSDTLREEIQRALAQYEAQRAEEEDLVKQRAAIALQNSFIQPGATKFHSDAEDPNRRFLCWNRMGAIFARREERSATEAGEEEEEEDLTQSIEIELADSAAHRSIRFKDVHQFDRAALGATGALFSNAKQDVFFRALDANTHSNWKHQLPENGERVIALACGDTFSCVATSEARLRVFRPSSLQEPVLALRSNRIKTMVAARSRLFILYQGNTTEDEKQQEYDYQVFDLETSGYLPRLVASGSVCCSAPIVWSGFADEDSYSGAPALYLKNGSLLLLLPPPAAVAAAAQRDGEWSFAALQVVSQQQQTRLWPIALGKTGLLCVALRAQKRQPSVFPRSTPALFNVKMPLLGATMQRAENKTSFDHEQHSLLQLMAGDDVLFDVLQLKAMVVAIRSQQLARAFGHVERMLQVKTLEIALDKAGEAGAPLDFLQRVEAVKSEKEQMEREEQEEEEEEEEPAPFHKRLKFEEEQEEEEERVVVPSSPPAPKPAAAQGSGGSARKNKFLIASSQALRSPTSSPMRSPSSPIQLNRQSSFATSAREEERRRN